MPLYVNYVFEVRYLVFYFSANFTFLDSKLELAFIIYLLYVCRPTFNKSTMIEMTMIIMIIKHFTGFYLGEVGFLREDRRLNVAITRARRHLAVIGDSQTISHHFFLNSFYDYVTEHGEVRSAQTYMHVRGEFVGASAAESITDDLLKDFEKLGAHSKTQSDIKTESGDARTERQSSSDTHSLEPTSSNAQSVLSKRSSESHRSADRKSNTEPTEDVQEDHDNDVVRYTREEIEAEVQKFLGSKTEELNFDSSLGSKGRFWVHELAEKYGLAHWSTGVGRDRCISIKKKKRKSKQKCEYLYHSVSSTRGVILQLFVQALYF